MWQGVEEHAENLIRSLREELERGRSEIHTLAKGGKAQPDQTNFCGCSSGAASTLGYRPVQITFVPICSWLFGGTVQAALSRVSTRLSDESRLAFHGRGGAWGSADHHLGREGGAVLGWGLHAHAD
jgi:hypothetical protein